VVVAKKVGATGVFKFVNALTDEIVNKKGIMMVDKRMVTINVGSQERNGDVRVRTLVE